MDLHISLTVFTVLFLSAAGLCSCQNELLLDGPLDGEVGGSVVFTLINPPSAPPTKITWTCPSNTVIITSLGDTEMIHPEYIGRVSVNKTTASLDLRSLTLHDTGEYTVNITVSSSGVEQFGKTSLAVFERISTSPIISTGGTLIAGNSSVNLTCDAQGTIITREWTKDGTPLFPSNSTTFYEDNRTLSISPVEKEDNGQYTCTVSNPVSSVSENHNLVVKYGPEEIVIIGTKAVDTGNFIHLTCLAKSIPESIYTWAFNGTEISGASYIKEQSGHEDSGKYTCTARNSITNLSQNTYVDVSVTDQKEVNSLSAGAIAGIAVACLVFGLAVGAGGSFFAMRKRNVSGNSRKKDAQDSPFAPPSTSNDAASHVYVNSRVAQELNMRTNSGTVAPNDHIYDRRLSYKSDPIDEPLYVN
ncbi:carcinoembryonic antigen-related cell adhesion molecule 20-like isoform X1 [Alosa sapidissima]|uniref:carcinoembryonic antigen-related cell adhesion molecule 20-like isoform X1 n=1 Tax=Alosa sapidissima TaxID=34773 RepID=UPI001C080018|nr:carcinoembryonic antigen-related cell adhesion molecule 20-like isoform X1 [Alosa sapidissima]